MPGISYVDQLRVLEERHRPGPRAVFPYLLRSAKRGMSDAARAAEEHADQLERLDPPPHAVTEHREYVAALRAVAHDARQLADQKRRQSGRGLLNDLRALPSFQTMLEARRRLLEDLAG